MGRSGEKHEMKEEREIYVHTRCMQDGHLNNSMRVCVCVGRCRSTKSSKNDEKNENKT